MLTGRLLSVMMMMTWCVVLLKRHSSTVSLLPKGAKAEGRRIRRGKLRRAKAEALKRGLVAQFKLNCEKKRKSRLRRTLVWSHGACLVSAVVADVAGQAATVAMEQTKERKGRLAPSSLSGHNHGGFDGWAVHEARSPQATSPLRAAGNAVLAGRRIARERWQPEAPPSEPRSLKVDFFLANAFHITQ